MNETIEKLILAKKMHKNHAFFPAFIAVENCLFFSVFSSTSSFISHVLYNHSELSRQLVSDFQNTVYY